MLSDHINAEEKYINEFVFNKKLINHLIVIIIIVFNIYYLIIMIIIINMII
jgi:hypothetical protein